MKDPIGSIHLLIVNALKNIVMRSVKVKMCGAILLVILCFLSLKRKISVDVHTSSCLAVSASLVRRSLVARVLFIGEFWV